jgi:hypothetical protein
VGNVFLPVFPQFCHGQLFCQNQYGRETYTKFCNQRKRPIRDRRVRN